jgi:S-formylglutathione hydrolase FrmB
MKINLIILLVFLPFSSFCASVKTFLVDSQVMQKTIPNSIILPITYSKDGPALPVVYALHGATDDHTFWPTFIPQIKELADQYGIIVVCPDGAKTSWYLDSPLDRNFQYDSYISQELVKHVDKTYNTDGRREARAIMGLSMGGFGAFYLAFRHTEIWSATVSTSGGFDLRPFPDNWDIAARIGKQSEYPENWQKYSIVNMTQSLAGKKLNLFFDVGVDDFFYPSNKQLHETLLEKNIPHLFLLMPGGHELSYWQKSIPFHFIFLNAHFEQINSP